MSHSESTAVPGVNIPEPPMTKFERERRAFYRLLPDLVRTHRGQYVAVHDERITDSGPDRFTVANRVLEKVGPADIYVGLALVEPVRPSRSGVLRDIERRKARQ